MSYAELFRTARPFLVTVLLTLISGCENADRQLNNAVDTREAEAENVQRVHAQDEAAHKIFDAEMKSAGGTLDVRKACHSLLAALEDLDASGCPTDYREQFEKYVSEVAALCEVLDSHPTEPPQTPVEQAAGELSQQRLLAGIAKTNECGETLRQIASKYGAEIGH